MAFNSSSAMVEPNRAGNDAMFSFGVRAVLLLIVQTGALSLVAVLLLLALVLWNHRRRRRVKFFRKPVDHFFFGLLVADIVQAIGHITGLAWVVDGQITPGATCTVEGVFRHVGEVGVALFTLAIAIYTFLVIFLRWNVPTSRWLPILVNGSIVLFLLLMVAISPAIHRNPPFYGPSGHWCWIDPEYFGERIGLEYAIFWLVAAVNIGLYIPLFFSLRSEATKAQAKLDTQQKKASMAVAKKMLLYPIAYIILILPMSIIRWIQFVNPHVEVSAGWIAVAGITFGSSGFVNVLMYIVTRPSLLPSLRNRADDGDGDTATHIRTDGLELNVPQNPNHPIHANRQHRLDDEDED